MKIVITELGPAKRTVLGHPCLESSIATITEILKKHSIHQRVIPLQSSPKKCETTQLGPDFDKSDPK